MIYEINDIQKVDMKMFKKAIKAFNDKIDEIIISKKYNKIIIFAEPFFNFCLFKEIITK